jgi:hypothetical protein
MSHEEKEILKRLLRESKENAEEIARVLHIVREIERELRPHPKPITASIAVQFSGEPPMPNNALTLNVGQTSQASILPLLADGITPSGGTLSAVSYTFSDASAIVVLNADGLTATVTGVADSAGVAVSGTATCSVTDTDGVVSQWSQAFTITTLGVVPPAQLTQSVAVQFSTPTP